MNFNWYPFAVIVLIWLYPWFVINFELFKIFYIHRGLIKGNRENKKLVIRESIGEKRYLIPVFNWTLLGSILGGKDIIDSFLKNKLTKNMEKTKTVEK